MATTLALTPLLAADNEPAKRLDDAAAVFSEIMATPDKGIPQELLENAHCIVIVPDLKTAAFVVGGKYGKGYLSCGHSVLVAIARVVCGRRPGRGHVTPGWMTTPRCTARSWGNPRHRDDGSARARGRREADVSAEQVLG